MRDKIYAISDDAVFLQASNVQRKPAYPRGTAVRARLRTPITLNFLLAEPQIRDSRIWSDALLQPQTCKSKIRAEGEKPRETIVEMKHAIVSNGRVFPATLLRGLCVPLCDLKKYHTKPQSIERRDVWLSNHVWLHSTNGCRYPYFP